MLTETARAGIALLAQSQAEKPALADEAFIQLDALLCARLLDRDLSAPPVSPAEGDCYLVKATATGAWTGNNGAIAHFADGAWNFYPPFAGLSAYVTDETKLVVFDGSAWVDYAQLLVLQNVPLLGVNATADATNKLAVKSAVILFDNTGTGIQAKLNKHAAADTASLLYQTNYSGRAEMGLTGDDNFHLKVSPNGTTWTEALTIDKTTGRLGIGTTTPASIVEANVDGATSNVALVCYSSAPSGGFLVRQARGTRASPASIQNGDILGTNIFAGYDGGNFRNSAGVRAAATENWASGTNAGAQIELQTTTNGSISRTTKLTIHHDGRLQHNGARADQSYLLQVPTTGFSITIADACGALLLNPAGTLAAGTITLPASPKDGQLCRIATTQTITALTVGANTGQTLNGAPTTLAANGFVHFAYVSADATWYRIG